MQRSLVRTRNGIVAMTAPGMASSDPAGSQSCALERAMEFKGFERVFAARGLIAARWWEPGRDQHAVTPNRHSHNAAAPAHFIPAGFSLGARLAHVCLPSLPLVLVNCSSARRASRRSFQNGALTVPRLATHT